MRYRITVGLFLFYAFSLNAFDRTRTFFSASWQLSGPGFRTESRITDKASYAGLSLCQKFSFKTDIADGLLTLVFPEYECEGKSLISSHPGYISFSLVPDENDGGMLIKSGTIAKPITVGRLTEGSLSISTKERYLGIDRSFSLIMRRNQDGTVTAHWQDQRITPYPDSGTGMKKIQSFSFFTNLKRATF